MPNNGKAGSAAVAVKCPEGCISPWKAPLSGEEAPRLNEMVPVTTV